MIFIKWWRIKNNSSQIGLKNTTHIHHTVNTTVIATELYNYKFQLVGGSLRWTSNEYGTLWLCREQQLCTVYYMVFFWKENLLILYVYRLAVWLLDSLVRQAWSSIDTPTRFFWLDQQKRMNLYLDVWILKFTVLPSISSIISIDHV